MPTKVRLVKAMVFPVVMYGCEIWILKKIEQIEGVKLIGHITDAKFGQVLVTRDNQEFTLKAQGWNPLSSEIH